MSWPDYLRIFLNFEPDATGPDGACLNQNVLDHLYGHPCLLS